jgi:hypothetical protein
MLNKTLEFLRISDPQPNAEKVRGRRETAQALVTELQQNRATLLQFLQGIVVGFDFPPLTQESPATILLIKSIKHLDETLPLDLKENALDLRATACIAVGELLTERSDGAITTANAVLAALSVRSALSIRPTPSEKYLRWALDTLLKASDEVIMVAAENRRKTKMSALEALGAIKAPATDPWATLGPAVNLALGEVSVQAAIDREELETLWWMFAAYSEIERKPLADLSPAGAAFCSGVELAKRALLPPALSAVGLVRRAVLSERNAAALSAIALQDAAKEWAKSMLSALLSTNSAQDHLISQYPALLPLSWGCRRLRECADGSQELGKEFTAATGIPLNLQQFPFEWGAQVFRESVLLRAVTEGEEN